MAEKTLLEFIQDVDRIATSEGKSWSDVRGDVEEYLGISDIGSISEADLNLPIGRYTESELYQSSPEYLGELQRLAAEDVAAASVEERSPAADPMSFPYPGSGLEGSVDPLAAQAFPEAAQLYSPPAGVGSLSRPVEDPGLGALGVSGGAGQMALARRRYEDYLPSELGEAKRKQTQEQVSAQAKEYAKRLFAKGEEEGLDLGPANILAAGYKVPLRAVGFLGKGLVGGGEEVHSWIDPDLFTKHTIKDPTAPGSPITVPIASAIRSELGAGGGTKSLRDAIRDAYYDPNHPGGLPVEHQTDKQKAAARRYEELLGGAQSLGVTDIRPWDADWEIEGDALGPFARYHEEAKAMNEQIIATREAHEWVPVAQELKNSALDIADVATALWELGTFALGIEGDPILSPLGEIEKGADVAGGLIGGMTADVSDIQESFGRKFSGQPLITLFTLVPVLRGAISAGKLSAKGLRSANKFLGRFGEKADALMSSVGGSRPAGVASKTWEIVQMLERELGNPLRRPFHAAVRGGKAAKKKLFGPGSRFYEDIASSESPAAAALLEETINKRQELESSAIDEMTERMRETGLGVEDTAVRTSQPFEGPAEVTVSDLGDVSGPIEQFPDAPTSPIEGLTKGERLIAPNEVRQHAKTEYKWPEGWNPGRYWDRSVSEVMAGSRDSFGAMVTTSPGPGKQAHTRKVVVFPEEIARAESQGVNTTQHEGVSFVRDHRGDVVLVPDGPATSVRPLWSQGDRLRGITPDGELQSPYTPNPTGSRHSAITESGNLAYDLATGGYKDFVSGHAGSPRLVRREGAEFTESYGGAASDVFGGEGRRLQTDKRPISRSAKRRRLRERQRLEGGEAKRQGKVWYERGRQVELSEAQLRYRQFVREHTLDGEQRWLTEQQREALEHSRAGAPEAPRRLEEPTGYRTRGPEVLDERTGKFVEPDRPVEVAPEPAPRAVEAAPAPEPVPAPAGRGTLKEFSPAEGSPRTIQEILDLGEVADPRSYQVEGLPKKTRRVTKVQKSKLIKDILKHINKESDGWLKPEKATRNKKDGESFDGYAERAIEAEASFNRLRESVGERGEFGPRTKSDVAAGQMFRHDVERRLEGEVAIDPKVLSRAEEAGYADEIKGRRQILENVRRGEAEEIRSMMEDLSDDSLAELVTKEFDSAMGLKEWLTSASRRKPEATRPRETARDMAPEEAPFNIRDVAREIQKGRFSSARTEGARGYVLRSKARHAADVEAAKQASEAANAASKKLVSEKEAAIKMRKESMTPEKASEMRNAIFDESESIGWAHAQEATRRELARSYEFVDKLKRDPKSADADAPAAMTRDARDEAISAIGDVAPSSKLGRLKRQLQKMRSAEEHSAKGIFRLLGGKKDLLKRGTDSVLSKEMRKGLKDSGNEVVWGHGVAESLAWQQRMVDIQRDVGWGNVLIRAWKKGRVLRDLGGIVNASLANWFVEAATEGNFTSPIKAILRLKKFRSWEKNPSARDKGSIDDVFHQSARQNRLVASDINTAEIDLSIRALEGKTGKLASAVKTVDKWYQPIESTWKSIDRSFKLSRAWTGFNRILSDFFRMKDGDSATVKVGRNKSYTISKDSSGWSIDGVGVGASPSAKRLPKRVERIIADSAAFDANSKFFDYRKRSKYQILLADPRWAWLVSPFYSWTHYALTAPGKEGLAGAMLRSEPTVSYTSPDIQIRQNVRKALASTRTLLSIQGAQQDMSDTPDVAKTSAAWSSVDPVLLYKDGDGTVMARQLGAFAPATTLADQLGSIAWLGQKFANMVGLDTSESDLLEMSKEEYDKIAPEEIKRIGAVAQQMRDMKGPEKLSSIFGLEGGVPLDVYKGFDEETKGGGERNLLDMAITATAGGASADFVNAFIGTVVDKESPLSRRLGKFLRIRAEEGDVAFDKDTPERFWMATMANVASRVVGSEEGINAATIRRFKWTYTRNNISPITKRIKAIQLRGGDVSEEEVKLERAREIMGMVADQMEMERDR